MQHYSEEVCRAVQAPEFLPHGLCVGTDPTEGKICCRKGGSTQVQVPVHFGWGSPQEHSRLLPLLHLILP